MPSLTSVELDTNRILVYQAKTFLRRGLCPGIGLLKAVIMWVVKFWRHEIKVWTHWFCWGPAVIPSCDKTIWLLYSLMDKSSLTCCAALLIIHVLKCSEKRTFLYSFIVHMKGKTISM